jgi:hypothetical protein
MNIPSNTTAEEYFKYYCKDENAKIFYDQLIGQLIDADRNFITFNNEAELIEEQLYFAKELILALESELNRPSVNLKSFKKFFEIAKSNSYLEF